MNSIAQEIRDILQRSALPPILDEGSTRRVLELLHRVGVTYDAPFWCHGRVASFDLEEIEELGWDGPGQVRMMNVQIQDLPVILRWRGSKNYQIGDSLRVKVWPGYSKHFMRWKRKLQGREALIEDGMFHFLHRRVRPRLLKSKAVLG